MAALADGGADAATRPTTPGSLPMTLNRRLLWPLVLLALAACASPPPPPEFRPISFAARGMLALDVAAIDVERRYRPPLAEPNVEHGFPITPVAALEAWPRERLRAAGSSGTARFVIEEASVVREALPKAGGLKGLVTTEQEARYSALFKVALKVAGADGRSGEVRTEARRARSLPEGVTLNERDRFFYELTRDTLAELDTALEQNIREHLADFLLPR